MLTPNNFMPVEHEWVAPQPGPTSKPERIAKRIFCGFGEAMISLSVGIFCIAYVAIVVGVVFWIVSHF